MATTEKLDSVLQLNNLAHVTFELSLNQLLKRLIVAIYIGLVVLLIVDPVNFSRDKWLQLVIFPGKFWQGYFLAQQLN